MKKLFFIIGICMLFLTGCSNKTNLPIEDSVENVRIRLTINSDEIYIVLVDNSATRDLVSRLKEEKITLSFSDFNQAEKIAYIEPRLNCEGAKGTNPSVGDVTIYKPWGNFAFFYKDTSGYSDSLVAIGKVEDDGIEILVLEEEFTATMELVE